MVDVKLYWRLLEVNSDLLNIQSVIVKMKQKGNRFCHQIYGVITSLIQKQLLKSFSFIDFGMALFRN